MAIRPFKGVMPNLGEGVYVDPLASVIGQVTMGQDCSVWPSASIRGDILPIVIGLILMRGPRAAYAIPQGLQVTLKESFTVIEAP